MRRIKRDSKRNNKRETEYRMIIDAVHRPHGLQKLLFLRPHLYGHLSQSHYGSGLICADGKDDDGSPINPAPFLLRW